jgi:hypothetical protein
MASFHCQIVWLELNDFAANNLLYGVHNFFTAETQFGSANSSRFTNDYMVTAHSFPSCSGQGYPVPPDWSQGKPIPGNTKVVKVIKDFGIVTVVCVCVCV